MERILPTPVNILYLCTGNSCRSQMAEGWTRQLGRDQVVVQSAGIEAHGKNPRAIEVMIEAEIDISRRQPWLKGQYDRKATASGRTPESLG